MGVSIKEHRRRWLRLLVETYGSQREVAKRVEGLAPAYISQILNGVRDMGDQLARRIERAFGMESMSLDNPSTWHAFIEELEGGDKGRPAAPVPAPDYELVPTYALNGGHHPSEPNGTSVFARSLIDERRLEAASLVAFEVPDDAMAPEYHAGDLALVDTRPRDPVNGRVYAFRVDHQIRPLRLYKNLSGSYTVRTDNQDDPRFTYSETVTANKLRGLDLLGEVVWRGG